MSLNLPKDNGLGGYWEYQFLPKWCHFWSSINILWRNKRYYDRTGIDLSFQTCSKSLRGDACNSGEEPSEVMRFGKT
jgi:hypothetical protein